MWEFPRDDENDQKILSTPHIQHHYLILEQTLHKIVQSTLENMQW